MAEKIGNIPKKWKVLSGENEWNKLLDPLDIDLRQYIIHYGEMAQATYDTLNPKKPSEIAPMDELFSKAGLEKGNPFKYRVTKYIYATSPSCKSNWMGYVAVTTDEGKAALGRTDIAVAWRGTSLDEEKGIDSKANLVSASNLLGVSGDPRVHEGWYSYYTSDPTSSFDKKSARDQVVDEVKRLVEEYKKEEISITITGHSMGASIATLNAVDIVSNKFNKACPVTAFAFASPRVGNENFKKVFAGLAPYLHVLRVCNANDGVPYTPLEYLHYVHVGKVLDIDTSKSMYLKSLGRIIFHKLEVCHNLEVYLHGIAGTQGPKRLNRDIAVVNKRLDALKDEYGVPVSWWWDENKKGMVQQDDGSWKLING